MKITIHFDTRAGNPSDYEYGVTVKATDGTVALLPDVVALEPDRLVALGEITPEIGAAIRGAGRLAWVANAGRLSPPEIDAIADGAGWGVIEVL